MIGKLGLMPTPPCLGELSLLREGGGIPSVCECVCPKKYQSSQCLKYQIFFNFSITFLNCDDLKCFQLTDLLILCHGKFVISRIEHKTNIKKLEIIYVDDEYRIY